MSRLSASNLSFTYRTRQGEARALDEVDFDLADGEVLAILGPSGCGKSTLLRVVAGLLDGYGGSVLIDGEPIDDLAVHRRGFGLMFQSHALFDHHDVATNIGFGLEMAGIAAAERTRRVADLLDLVGLGGYAKRAVSTLSGGEAQRVALARALAPKPRVLLLDEPLAALDRQRRDGLVDELGRILGGVGQTAMYVTHDRDEAFALADRVAIMREGRIERLGTPTEVWRDPRNRFVAQFVGHRTVVELPGPAGTRRWASVPADALRHSSEMTTAVAATSDGARRVIDLRVQSVRFRGDRTDCDAIDDAGQRFALPSALARSAGPAGGALSVGDHVSVVIDESMVAWLQD